MKIYCKIYGAILLFLSMISCDSKNNRQMFESNAMAQDSLRTQLLFRMPYLPDSLYFAGEKIPLENEEVRQRLVEELLIHANRHAKTLLVLHQKPFWEQEVKRVLQSENVPTDFVYLAIAESDFNVHAVSLAGAVGMWQLMPQTAKEYNLLIRKDIDQRKDVILATKSAAKYLKKAKQKFHKWSLAAISYNRGMKGLSTAMENQGSTNFYNTYLNNESSKYFFRILATKLIYENPNKYGFEYNPNYVVKSIHFVEIELEEGKVDLKKIIDKNKISVYQLKKYNPWILNIDDLKLDIKKKDRIKILLPKY